MSKKPVRVWIIERRIRGSSEDYQPLMRCERKAADAKDTVYSLNNSGDRQWEYRAVEYVRKK